MASEKTFRRDPGIFIHVLGETRGVGRRCGRALRSLVIVFLCYVSVGGAFLGRDLAVQQATLTSEREN